jgi:hypothetical protein
MKSWCRKTGFWVCPFSGDTLAQKVFHAKAIAENIVRFPIGAMYDGPFRSEKVAVIHSEYSVGRSDQFCF